MSIFKKFLSGVMIAMLCFSLLPNNMLASAATDFKALAKTYDKTVYTGNDLGATYSKNATTFKVWSPSAKLVKVNLYSKGSDSEKDSKLISTTQMIYDSATGVWSVKINGDLKNNYYTYSIFDGSTTKETVDIYAKAAGVNGNRGMIVDLASTNPEGWDKDTHVLAKSQSDAIIWEVQVKDFSFSSSSGVSNANRGKYLAFTENGTTVNGIDGNPSTCVDYLKKLGVTHVQINPFYDFGSVDEAGSDTQYNWGYDPKNYNVPEGSFSSNPYDGNVRINECKQMIQALHNAGIGVIMDVVYNHTYETENSWFNITVPNYYYRMNADGSWSNGSGCGNDTASEHKMFRKFMIDSVLYWATEYHIDGFRFDLMGLHDVDTMNAIRAELDKLENGKQILMYGEAWKMETASDSTVLLANQNNMSKLNERIGAFNDGIRDGLKGSVFSATEGGYLQNGSGKANVKIGIQGQSTSSGWASAPTQTVTYSSCHDNYTLYDKLVASVYGTDSDYRTRYENLVAMNKLNGAIILSSQGTSFMLAGEEMARSKDGDENSFKSSAALNMIDWKNISTYSDITEYYKGLIKIRKAFAPFTDETADTANKIKFFEKAEKPIIGYTIEDASATNSWNKMAVIFNGDNKNSIKVQIEGDNLPNQWVIVANNETAGLRNLGEVSGNGTVEIPASSAMLLVDKDSFNKANLKESEGVVISKFYDGNNLVNTQVVSGKIGDKYEVTPSTNFALHYNILSSSGKTTGNFSDSITEVKFNCKKYDGKFSKVIFKYIDEDSKQSLCEDISITNRVGQQYNTSAIASFSGYSLDVDNLPKNGAGKFADKDTTVTYSYKKLDKVDKENGIVNVIYMDQNGKILDKQTLNGKIDEEYTTSNKSYDGLTLLSTPANATGKFSSKEVNIIYSYGSQQSQNAPVDMSQQVVLIVCIVAAFLIVAGSVTATIIKTKKKTRQDELEIDD